MSRHPGLEGQLERQREFDDLRQRFESLFEQNPDAVYSLDVDGNFTSANRACEAITGYTRDELVGTSFFQLVAPVDWARTRQHFGAAMGGVGQDFELTLVHKQGSRIELQLINVPIVVDAKLVGAHGMATRLLAQLDLGDEDAAQLLEVSAERLIEAQNALIRPGAAMLGDLQIGPVITPAYLDAHPFDPAATPSAAEVPLMIGCNLDEMAFGMGLDPRLSALDDAAAARMAVDALGEYAAALYPA